MKIEQRVKTNPHRDHRGDITSVSITNRLAAVDTESSHPVDAPFIKIDGRWMEPCDYWRSIELDKQWKDNLK